MYEEKKPGEKRRGGRRRREKEREDKNVKMGKTRKRRGAERERERVRGEGGIKHHRVHHGMTSATKPTTFSELKLSHSFFALSCPRGRSGWTISRG